MDPQTRTEGNLLGPDPIRMEPERRKPSELLRLVTDAYLDFAGFASEPLLIPIIAEERFWLWPASCNDKHHCFAGGLAQHTLEVLQFCRAMAESPPFAGRINHRVLATGALWHDFGKVDEYAQAPPRDYKPVWEHSPAAKRGVTHIMAGLMHWGTEIREPLYQTDHENIAHLIASHHGRLEWGSPVVPESAEALILHQADMLSVMADSGMNPQRR